MACFVALATLSLPAFAEERLMVTPPEGWRLSFDQDQVGSRYREWVPPNQGLVDGSQTITVQEVDKSGVGLESYAENLVEKQNAFCAEPLVAGPERYQSGPYPAVAYAVQCNRPEGIPTDIVSPFEFMMIKVIEGPERLYVATRNWQGIALDYGHPRHSEAAEAAWTAFFSSFRLCNVEHDPACGS